jgi:hypothetical protein
MANLDAAGTATGTTTLLGTVAIFVAVSGLASGQAVVSGDVWPQGAGVALGSSTVVGAAAVIYNVSASVQGEATVTASVGRIQIVTGQLQGSGTLEADLTTTVAGTATGSSLMTGSAFRTINAKGLILGRGEFKWVGAPLPVYGSSTMVGFPIVESRAPAVWAVVCSPKQFRYRQLLQRGDLPIFICDRAGPVSPVWVRYTMYHILRCGARRRIGPARRVPVSGKVGEFYVSGRAGDLGQPGSWLVLWEWRYGHTSATQSKEMQFEVLDAVLADCPRDTTVRHRKYGWS